VKTPDAGQRRRMSWGGLIVCSIVLLVIAATSAHSALGLTSDEVAFGAACYAKDATTLRCTLTPTDADGGPFVYTIYASSSLYRNYPPLESTHCAECDPQVVTPGAVVTIALPAQEPDWDVLVSATEGSCDTECTELDSDLAGDDSGTVLIDTTGSEFPTAVVGVADSGPLSDGNGPTGETGPTGLAGPTGVVGPSGSVGPTGVDQSPAPYVLPSEGGGCGNYSPGGFFVGMYDLGESDVEGATARIDRYNPRICYSSSVWSMIFNPDQRRELAQVGWLKSTAWSKTKVYYFVEYGTYSTGLLPPIQRGEVPDPQVQDKFGVHIDPQTGDTIFARNLTTIFSQHLAWVNNAPHIAAEWAGETHTLAGDQTAGDNQQSVRFSSVAIELNGNWESESPAIDYAMPNDPRSSGRSVFSDINAWFLTWDSRYDSEAG